MKVLAWITAIALLSPSLPATAAEVPVAPENPIAQTPQPTRRQVLETCVQNRAETLPNPFRDVSPDHWAFKAVMTMHYCGAYRQATPPHLIDQLTGETEQQS